MTIAWIPQWPWRNPDKNGYIEVNQAFIRAKQNVHRVHITSCGFNKIDHTHFLSVHDDVIKWKHFPRNWPFVRKIHRSPVNFPHKGQWRGALMFSLIYVWINDWANNREAGDLRRQHGHYDVIVMSHWKRTGGKRRLSRPNTFRLHPHHCNHTRETDHRLDEHRLCPLKLQLMWTVKWNWFGQRVRWSLSIHMEQLFAVQINVVNIQYWARTGQEMGPCWRQLVSHPGLEYLHGKHPVALYGNISYVIRITQHINSLVPAICGSNFKYIIFKRITEKDRVGTRNEIAPKSMPQEVTTEKSTLVQVMAWCR